MKILPDVHNSPETAFIIEDYPFGRTLRCFKRIWIETATKGAKKGRQRVVYQTTVRSVNYIKDQYEKAPVEPHLWNKPKKGTYSALYVLTVDDETGYIGTDGISEYPSPDGIMKFKERVGEQVSELGTERKDRLDFFVKYAEKQLNKQPVATENSYTVENYS